MKIKIENEEVIDVKRLVSTGLFPKLHEKAHKKHVSRQYVNTMCHAKRLPNVNISGAYFIILGENGEVPQIKEKDRKLYLVGDARKPRKDKGKKRKTGGRKSGGNGKFKAIT